MKNSLKFIFKFIFLEKKLFLLGFLLILLVSGFTWLGPKTIAFIIDQGLVPGEQKLIFYGVLALAVSEIFRLVSIYLSQVTYAVLGQNVIEKVRAKMVTHLLSLPVQYFDRVSSGSMMTRVVNDVNSLTDFFQSGFVSVFGNFASIFAIFFGLFSLNFKLGLLLAAVFLPVAILCAYFSERLKKIYTDTRNQLSELNAMLADFLFGMKTIRALGMSKKKYQELNSQIRIYAGSQMQMVKTFALFHPTVSFGIGTLMLILVWHGLPLVSEGTLKVGEWVAALSYILSLQQPLVEISDRWNFFLAGLTSIERIQEVFKETPEKYGTAAALKIEKIEFRNLSLKYNGSADHALKNLSLTIHRGDWIGVFGESGSGKSTLLQMLYGFYPASEGEILWNGINYSHYDYASLRAHFGVVEQFPFLFSGTIEENITLFGEHPFSKEEMKETFKGFTLIESLLSQSDFVISERGGNLSMGQKQMITFLRAYLSKPDIWILDEATAFFDLEAEREVLQALERLKVDEITVIQVAHHPQALAKMKRVIQIHQGVVQPIHHLENSWSPIDLK